LENIQERYVQVLRSYLQHTNPHNPGRLGDLLAHIPEVSSIGSRSNSDVDVEPLSDPNSRQSLVGIENVLCSVRVKLSDYEVATKTRIEYSKETRREGSLSRKVPAARLGALLYISNGRREFHDE
jgi:hypothetical protein